MRDLRKRLPPTLPRGLRIALECLAIGILALGCLRHARVEAAEPDRLLRVPSSNLALHVAADLPQGLSLRNGETLCLAESDGTGKMLPGQLVAAAADDGTVRGENGRLLVEVPPREGAGDLRRFRLVRQAGQPPAPAFTFSPVDNKSLKLSEGDHPVLVYNHGTITGEAVPKSDSRRERGCYVHPLWGLGGEVLTDDFPRDHYHHHGVFWAWPHVRIAGKEYDLWMYRKITPRFVRWICRETGPLAAVLAVENGWFVGDKNVMIERVWLRAHRAAGDARSLDLDLTWIPVDRPITLRGAEGKSYGGLTVRFAVGEKKDAVITVPAGPAKQDLPETPLPWADLTAKFPGAAAPSGAAIFVPPDHPDYPPTWLTRHYGPLCVGWPGVKEKTFEPGKPIRLSYRIWIHKGMVGVEQLRAAYLGYEAGRKAAWE